MKILLAVSSLGFGGAERVASTLCNEWVRRKNQVTLVATYSKGGECFYPVDPRINLIYLKDRLRTDGRSIACQIQRLLALRKLIRDESPDVLVSFLTNVNVACILAAFGFPIPVIVCEHSNPIRQPLPLTLRIQRWLFYPFASLVVVLVNDIIKLLRNQPYVKSMVVVSNPIPPGLPVGSAIKKDYFCPGHHTLITMGRLESVKNYTLLIRAFSELASRYETWDLYLIGEGSERPMLERLIIDLRLEKRVFLLGCINEPWSIMAQADVFVMTSKYEGFPCALLEAMALGLPCVSSDCQTGPRDMSRDGQDAILFPVGNQQALTNALDSLMNSAANRERLGRQGMLSVSARYKIDAILDTWDHLFTQVRKRLG